MTNRSTIFPLKSDVAHAQPGDEELRLLARMWIEFCSIESRTKKAALANIEGNKEEEA
jgi:hypothetical protein